MHNTLWVELTNINCLFIYWYNLLFQTLNFWITISFIYMSIIVYYCSILLSLSITIYLFFSFLFFFHGWMRTYFLINLNWWDWLSSGSLFDLSLMPYHLIDSILNITVLSLTHISVAPLYKSPFCYLLLSVDNWNLDSYLSL